MLTATDQFGRGPDNRPTANRVLRALEDDNIIQLSRGQITVVDMAALRKRAR